MFSLYYCESLKGGPNTLMARNVRLSSLLITSCTVSVNVVVVHLVNLDV